MKTHRLYSLGLFQHRSVGSFHCTTFFRSNCFSPKIHPHWMCNGHMTFVGNKQKMAKNVQHW